MRRAITIKGMGRFFAILTVCVVASGCAEAGAPEVKELDQQTLLSSPPEGALILDVRTQGEFDSGHVPGAMNIPHDELSSRLAELDSEKGEPVVVYCRSGKRAGMASTVLLGAGYTNVLHLTGDMNAWQANGLPIEMPPASGEQ
jgi:phage shock protein E